MKLYKYHGAGNDFLLADNRDGNISLDPGQISALCDRRYGIGADGLMLLENAEGYDFRMIYYNSDGSGGMMCGNGGRCIAAFAADLGIPSRENARYSFIAADGPHQAEVMPADNATRSACRLGSPRIVRLRMKDVAEPVPVLGGWFLDTGTRHFVKFVDNLADYDVEGEGRTLRHAEEFAPVGANVNFAEPAEGILNVRTFEKGVEAETFACGTGITAAAIAACHQMHAASSPARTSPAAPACSAPTRALSDTIGRYADGRIHIEIHALRDSLSVDFLYEDGRASDVWLTGPAVSVGHVICSFGNFA